MKWGWAVLVAFAPGAATTRCGATVYGALADSLEVQLHSLALKKEPRADDGCTCTGINLEDPFL